MPGDYHYLDDSDAYVTVYWGKLSLLDLLETILSRAQDPDLKTAKVHVIDLSEPTWAEAPSERLHDQVDRLRQAFAPPKMRTILVAPGEFFYGFARFYAIVQVVYASARVDVVRSWDEAAAAAGMDLTSARAWAKERIARG